MGKQVSIALGLKINMGKKHHHENLKGINQQILQTDINVFKTFFSFLNLPSSRSGNVCSSPPWIIYMCVCVCVCVCVVVVGYHWEICP